MENKDEFDALLDEAEKTFFPSSELPSSSSGVQQSKTQMKSSVNTIDKLMDDLLDDDIEENAVVNPSKQFQSIELATNFIGIGSNKCFPVFLGGSAVAMGMSSRGIQRCCDQMRCTSCDFNVIWFNNYRWSDSCDYLFLRNNVPETIKLREKLVGQPGCRSYACQCSWMSTEGTVELPKHLKWVCTKHKQ